MDVTAAHTGEQGVGMLALMLQSGDVGATEIMSKS